MTRGEFLESLRIALQGKMSQGSVNEHLRYYENYIMEESRKGRTEQEVLDSLGDPRLIARTLVDVALHRRQGGFRAGTRASARDGSQSDAQGGFRAGTRAGAWDGSQSDAQGGFRAGTRAGAWDGSQSNAQGGFRAGAQADTQEGRGGFRFDSWYGKLLLFLVAVFVIIIVARLMTFLLPVVLLAMLVLLVVYFVRGSKDE